MHFNVTYYLNSSLLFDTGPILPMKVSDQTTTRKFSVSCTLASFEYAKKGILRGKQLGSTQFEIKVLNDNKAIICWFMFDGPKYTPMLSTDGKRELIKPFKELFKELFPNK